MIKNQAITFSLCPLVPIINYTHIFKLIRNQQGCTIRQALSEHVRISIFSVNKMRWTAAVSQILTLIWEKSLLARPSLTQKTFKQGQYQASIFVNITSRSVHFTIHSHNRCLQNENGFHFCQAVLHWYKWDAMSKSVDKISLHITGDLSHLHLHFTGTICKWNLQWVSHPPHLDLGDGVKISSN